MSAGQTAGPSGTPVRYIKQFSVAFGDLAANSTSVQTVAFPQALVSRLPVVTFSAIGGAVPVAGARCSANGVVELTVFNPTTGSLSVSTILCNVMVDLQTPAG